ncbi:protein NYNRIN-like [Cucumis melo var. makuwa]|uniref:Protein NYNRIN-like n=1 Tax=Cucumis melo var. makuwa TaxID=1194695 RepID=A0A5A7UIK1_CUCMM|nr:protein NYNRIN-like [Cucumis melo var. makuwa]TYJ96834.1 protein NYNRIN-like [Cucumis melo var. makuwa]
MQRSVRLVNTMQTSYINLQSLYIQLWLPGRSRLEDLIWLALLHQNHQQDILMSLQQPIISQNNGRQFSNSMIDKLFEKFKFKQYKSSMYNAAMNDIAEAFNKTLYNLLKKLSPSRRGIDKKGSVKHCGLIEPLITLLQGLHHIRLFTV